MHGVGNDVGTAENGTKNVRMCQIEQKTQNSPKMTKNVMPKSTCQWRKASVNDINVYMLWNMPIEAPGQMPAFRLFEGRVEAIVPSIEGERAGDQDSDRNRGDSDVDGMTSGGGINLIQVEAVLLATESVYALEPKKMNQGLTSLVRATHLSRRYRFVG